jgi:hypothetical protein
MFPHGKIHLDTDPPRRLKSGVTRLARLSDCTIYPVRLQGIAGEGKVISAVLLRGYPHMRCAPKLICDKVSGHACLEQLAAILEGRDLDPDSLHLESIDGEKLDSDNLDPPTPDDDSQELNRAS